MTKEVSWKNKKILVVGAHPDDNDFGCGATIAKAVKAGSKAYYLVATSGQKGSSDRRMTPDRLGEIRKREQVLAAKYLGVAEVNFLNYMDGELAPSLDLKERIVYFIRLYKPDMVFTMDPSRFYNLERGFVQHSDHRAIGEATIAAAYPLARDLLSIPEHLSEKLKPHKVKELWLYPMKLSDANYFVDISRTLDLKIRALAMHESQIENVKELKKRIYGWTAVVGKKAGYKNAEAFVRLRLPG